MHKLRPLSAETPFSGQATPPPHRQSVLLLEIVRGTTRHPVRPVLTERFLIGASPACDLRLGSGGMPALQSIIVREGDAYRWEAVAHTPTLCCNGEAVTSVILRNGDRMQVGGIEIAVRSVPADFLTDNDSPETALNADNELQHAPSADAVACGDVMSSDAAMEENVESLSASELVAKLDAEFRRVEQYESRRHLGAEALLQAALQTHDNSHHAETEKSHHPETENSHYAGTPGSGPTPAPVNSPPVTVPPTAQVEVTPNGDDDPEDARLLRHLEQMAVQLNDCARQLEQRADEIARSRNDLAEALLHVLDAERHLSERLRQLLERRRTRPVPQDESSRTAA